MEPKKIIIVGDDGTLERARAVSSYLLETLGSEWSCDYDSPGPDMYVCRLTLEESTRSVLVDKRLCGDTSYPAELGDKLFVEAAAKFGITIELEATGPADTEPDREAARRYEAQTEEAPEQAEIPVTEELAEEEPANSEQPIHVEVVTGSAQEPYDVFAEAAFVTRDIAPRGYARETPVMSLFAEAEAMIGKPVAGATAVVNTPKPALCTRCGTTVSASEAAKCASVGIEPIHAGCAV